MNDPDVDVVQYRPELRHAFEELNRTWIEESFEMEEADRAYLSHPERHVIEPGGEILFVLENENPVGTCALIKRGEDVFELAKMAVARSARGRSYGRLLLNEALAVARDCDASRVYLVTDKKLEAAVALYESAGFKRIERNPAQPYQRGNLQMELDLSEHRDTA